MHPSLAAPHDDVDDRLTPMQRPPTCWWLLQRFAWFNTFVYRWVTNDKEKHKVFTQLLQLKKDKKMRMELQHSSLSQEIKRLMTELANELANQPGHEWPADLIDYKQRTKLIITQKRDQLNVLYRRLTTLRRQIEVDEERCQRAYESRGAAQHDTELALAGLTAKIEEGGEDGFKPLSSSLHHAVLEEDDDALDKEIASLCVRQLTQRTDQDNHQLRAHILQQQQQHKQRSMKNGGSRVGHKQKHGGSQGGGPSGELFVLHEGGPEDEEKQQHERDEKEAQDEEDEEEEEEGDEEEEEQADQEEMKTRALARPASMATTTPKSVLLMDQS